MIINTKIKTATFIIGDNISQEIYIFEAVPTVPLKLFALPSASLDSSIKILSGNEIIWSRIKGIAFAKNKSLLKKIPHNLLREIIKYFFVDFVTQIIKF